MRPFVAVLAVLLGLSVSRYSAAFCGFYVSGADARLTNRATHVVLMRSGTRTVLAMQNAYEGPPQDFALVVPVPVVLQKEQVKTLPRRVFDRVDQLGAPRLVELWERDPCEIDIRTALLPNESSYSGGRGPIGVTRAANEPAVQVEAQFGVGEYDVVLLSATDSTALDSWLRTNKYKIPDGAEPHLRPYVQAGMKFFVAKVNIQKVQMQDGRATLSPLRFHYDSETFSLPIRLGLINAGDAQDLIVSILAEDQRYEVANYPNVAIPTNLDVAERTRDSFGSFYAALFDETLRQKPGAVVTEYAWAAAWCDPCPGPTLSTWDVVTLGADVATGIPQAVSNSGDPFTVAMDSPVISGSVVPKNLERWLMGIPPGSGGVLRCYEEGRRKNPSLQGSVRVRLQFDPNGTFVVNTSGSDLPDKGVVSCMAREYGKAWTTEPRSNGGTVRQDIQLLPFATIGPRDLTLTRLHMRYSAGALGEDLVFKEARPIEGGRELRVGGPEHGVSFGQNNTFQARYAIRHPWTGPIACKAPVRDRWGRPPEGARPPAKAARDLAFVRRGADLGTFLTAALPSISALTTAAPDTPPPAPGSASASSGAPAATSSDTPPPVPPSPGCGCTTVPESGQRGWGAVIGLLAALGIRRRGSLRRGRG